MPGPNPDQIANGAGERDRAAGVTGREAVARFLRDADESLGAATGHQALDYRVHQSRATDSGDRNESVSPPAADNENLDQYRDPGGSRYWIPNYRQQSPRHALHARGAGNLRTSRLLGCAGSKNGPLMGCMVAAQMSDSRKPVRGNLTKRKLDDFRSWHGS